MYLVNKLRERISPCFTPLATVLVLYIIACYLFIYSKSYIGLTDSNAPGNPTVNAQQWVWHDGTPYSAGNSHWRSDQPNEPG